MKTILVDALHTFVVQGQGIYRPMHVLLEQYPNPKIIVTNADDEQMHTFGMRALPYPVFTMRHNPEKTDPQYFRMLLNQFGLQAEDIVYIEHNPEAIRSAQSLAIHCFHYDAVRKDMDALKAFLDREARQ